MSERRTCRRQLSLMDCQSNLAKRRRSDSAETESKAENDLQPLSPHSSESVKGSTCDTSQVEDDIVLATSSQGNSITVNSRGSTTVVIISKSIGGNEYNSPNTSPDDSIENKLAMKLNIESVIDNFASLEKNRWIFLLLFSFFSTCFKKPQQLRVRLKLKKFCQHE